GRQTLVVGALALILAIIPGAVLGLAAGYSRENGLTDLLIGTLINTFLAVPPLLLSLVVITVMGNGSAEIGIAVGLTGMPSGARVIWAASRVILAQPYIEATQALGATHWRIVSRHLLPNIAPTLLAFGIVTLSWAILNSATLHFLGFGGDPSQPEWGAM